MECIKTPHEEFIDGHEQEIRVRKEKDALTEREGIHEGKEGVDAEKPEKLGEAKASESEKPKDEQRRELTPIPGEIGDDEARCGHLQ